MIAVTRERQMESFFDGLEKSFLNCLDELTLAMKRPHLCPHKPAASRLACMRHIYVRIKNQVAMQRESIISVRCVFYQAAICITCHQRDRKELQLQDASGQSWIPKLAKLVIYGHLQTGEILVGICTGKSLVPNAISLLAQPQTLHTHILLCRYKET